MREKENDVGESWEKINKRNEIRNMEIEKREREEKESEREETYRSKERERKTE